MAIEAFNLIELQRKIECWKRQRSDLNKNGPSDNSVCPGKRWLDWHCRCL